MMGNAAARVPESVASAPKLGELVRVRPRLAWKSLRVGRKNVESRYDGCLAYVLIQHPTRRDLCAVGRQSGTVKAGGRKQWTVTWFHSSELEAVEAGTTGRMVPP